MKSFIYFLLGALCVAFTSITQAEDKVETKPAPTTSGNSKIVVGGGCFWCVEAVFQRLDGVKKCVSGYAGGHVENPTYEQICTKTTGHAEVVEVEFDSAKVTLDTVLDVFFAAHDPTTPNQQGADKGPQYRSVIYFTDDAQKKAAEEAVKRNQKEWKNPIVTEVGPLKKFYKAEDYHQNYYNQNADKNPYCNIVIGPKIQKLVTKGVIKAEP